jgi:hypothetical protein
MPIVLRHTWGWLLDVLPEISNLILVLVGVGLSLPKLAERVEEYKPTRLAIAALCFLIGLGGFWSSVKQKHELESQINQLVNSAITQATKDDLRSLGEHIDSGFDRLVAAVIAGRAGKGAGKDHPLIPPKPPPQTGYGEGGYGEGGYGGSAPQHIHYTTRRAPSVNPAAPYGLQVVIQTDVTIQPVSVGVTCDGEIEDAKAFVAGVGVMMAMAQGYSQDRKTFLLRFQYPSITPSNPLIVTLFSKTPIRVSKVELDPQW